MRVFFFVFFPFFLLVFGDGKKENEPLTHTTHSLTLTPTKKNNSLHSVHEGDKPFELELAWVCDASGRRFERVPADVAAAAEAAAKAALADSDMDE